MGSRTRNSTPKPPQGATSGASGASGASGTDLAAQRERTTEIATRLAELWPDAVVELDHASAYQLLVATILAAQSTDKLINTVTPRVFATYPTPAALAHAGQAELESMIFSTGFYRMKARHLIGMAQAIVERHGGQVPDTMAGLTDLPGVARKTANVVLGSALGRNEGIVVDTHVTRLAQRLGLSAHSDPVKIEQDLMQLVPRDQWSIFAHRLIWHGRRVCHAKQPDCNHCALAPLCPSAVLVATPRLMPPRNGRPALPSRAERAAAAKARASQRVSPATGRSAAARPGTVTARPATAKPVTARPVTAKPVTAKPVTRKSEASEPMNARSVTAGSVTRKSVINKSVINKSVTNQSTAVKPASARRATAKPAILAPARTRSARLAGPALTRSTREKRP
ncbi:MAG TPA: endonuclease III [Kofleriaceae bacterium]|jgi:endonuclease-3|nr:endonuclease III [Kofleriaceae bacterium]